MIARAVEADASLEARSALALFRVPGLGPKTIRHLIDRHGSARAVVEAFRGRPLKGPEGSERLRVPARVADALASLTPAGSNVLRELSRQGIQTLTYGAPDYPPSLMHLPDPPSVLFTRGHRALTGPGCIAVVGTRSATSYGCALAERIATGLARRGWMVVSGMARGIDAVAHRAALDAGGGSIGVLGSGLDYEFPAENRPLYRQMRARGALVSEFAPSQPPAAGCFPRRNRIIAALAEAVIVVQAGRRSGALNTAGHALDLGREVFAVPGPVGPAVSIGVHELLRDGAGLATSADDVLEALGHPRPGRSGDTTVGGTVAAGLGPSARRMVQRLEAGPCGADELAASAALDPGAALALISRLELDGWLVSRPGGQFERSRARAEPPAGRVGFA